MRPSGLLRAGARSRAGVLGVLALLVATVTLTHRRGPAAVITTHDPVLMERADRVVDLVDGGLHG